MAGTAEKWVARDGESLIWRDWDDGSAVYDKRSGRTHIFDLLARLVVVELTEAPASVRDLAGRVAETTGGEPDGAMRNQLHTLLGELKDLGIVEVIAA
jgi:PqqD family protein of HPr-rel-A system